MKVINYKQFLKGLNPPFNSSCNPLTSVCSREEAGIIYINGTLQTIPFMVSVDNMDGSLAFGWTFGGNKPDLDGKGLPE